MKIAFIINEFPSLSQTFVLNQITGLIDRGHDVDIFAENEKGGGKIHENVKKYNLLERTSYPLEISQSIVRRVFHSLRYIYKLFMKNPRAIFNSLNVLKYGRKALSLTLLYQIIPFLQKGPYDIIHCQFGMLGPQALLVKQVAAGTTKLITSFRGADASQWMQDRPGVYNELFKEGDLFCPVSQSLKKRIIQEGCNEKKIVVLHSSIDCEKFRYSRRRISKGEPTQILTIGRLVEKKGIRYALEAIARLVTSGRKVNYFVVGDGKLRGDLECLIEDLGIEKQVQLLGWRNQDEVIQLFQTMHILVAPSITATNGDQEGIPNVVKEAMALGLPVISTLHGGIPELVEDGVSGFLVKERDVDSLADRLSYLVDHPETWSKMGSEGRACIEKSYDMNKLNDQLVDLYKKTLHGYFR